MAFNGKITPAQFVNHDAISTWYLLPLLFISSRYLLDNPDIVAISNTSGTVYIYCLNNHPLIPEDENSRPDYILSGHSETCNSIDWNTNRRGYLTSGGTDGRVCIWDPQGLSEMISTEPLHSFSEMNSIRVGLSKEFHV